jgi:membrane-bound metal-dependent hydrolase YbcI (DUF457 family)
MNQYGHRGLSLLFSAPIVAVFLIGELYLFAGLFLSLVLYYSSVPDVDVRFSEYNKYGSTAVDGFDFIWVWVSKLAWYIGQKSGYITGESFSIQHRGITHTVWFGIAFGLVLSSLSVVGVSSVYIVGVGADRIGSLLNAPLLLLPVVVFLSGVAAVLLHCLGDVLTPTGIHFFTERNDYGYSLDQFRFDNEVANASSMLMGGIGFIGALLVGFGWATLPELYLLGGFLGIYVIGIPFWLFFVRTVLGDYTYKIYSFLKNI